MRRTASLLTLTALLVTLSPLTAGSASAAVARRTTIGCSGCWPTALAFSPSGDRLFYVERFTGEIRIYNFGTGSNRLWGRIPNLATSGEQGLLGIAVDPRWPNVRRLYVYYTNASPFENRIAKLRWDGDGTPTQTILARSRAASNHNGGVIHTGPGNYLFAVTGDAGSPSLSQNTGVNAGKVLRLTRSGGVPPGNPFPGEFVFSYGHRNSFGFTFDPRTGRLWQTENGPECDDEANFVRVGRNYGWGPNSDCPGTSESGPNPTQAEAVWNPLIAPTGATFCDGCQLGSAVAGRLLVGSWIDNRIRRLTLDADRNDVTVRRVIFVNPDGVLALESRPNGRVFFSDPNGIYRLVRV